jgi:hypothetical protein
MAVAVANAVERDAEESATNLCNRRLDPIDANHIDIVKPRDRQDVPYISFQTAMEDALASEKQRQQLNQIQKNTGRASSVPPPTQPDGDTPGGPLKAFPGFQEQESSGVTTMIAGNFLGVRPHMLQPPSEFYAH